MADESLNPWDRQMAEWETQEAQQPSWVKAVVSWQLIKMFVMVVIALVALLVRVASNMR